MKTEYSDLFGKYIVCPEYTLYNKEDYVDMAKNDPYPHRQHILSIGGVQEFNQTKVVIANEKGVLFERGKYRLTSMEKNMRQGKPPEVFHLYSVGILPLLCSEILYPEDYFHLKDQIGSNIKIVTHHVGFEMYDEHQFKAWRSLQKAVAAHFHCPVVCSSGGKRNELNLTGIIVVDEL